MKQTNAGMEKEPTGLRETCLFWSIACFGAILSLLKTSVATGSDVNFWHLPLLVDSMRVPQYADDAFTQSMTSFASGFWQAAVGLAPNEASLTFLTTALVVSRILFFAAFLSGARLFGVRSAAAQALFVLLVAFSSPLSGHSYAGHGAIFIALFSHSELANAPMFLSILCAAKGQIVRALALCGATFFLNAFMGVWLATPLLFIAVWLIRTKRVTTQQMFRRTALGLVPCAALCAPVLALIFRNPDFGIVIDYDYADFLRDFYPGHFLISATPPSEIAGLVMTLAAGSSAAHSLKRDDARASVLSLAMFGFAAVWALGALVPAVTHAPTILNLHLLRSSVGIHLFAGFALALLTTRWLSQRPMRPEPLLRGSLLALACASVRPALILAPFVVFARAQPLVLRPAVARVAALCTWLIIGAIWPAIIIKNQIGARDIRRDVAAWIDIARWARTQTDPEARFVLPDPSQGDGQASAAHGMEVFSPLAEREIMFNRKFGAHVMWRPTLRPLFQRRLEESAGLKDHEARMAYAAANGVSFVVAGCTEATGAVLHVERRCVYEAPREHPDGSAEAAADDAGSNAPRAEKTAFSGGLEGGPLDVRR